ncbi:type III secretion system export apparatus subunit SctT [Obesumbacterium proteus]|uniref:type III secretion system export apparatus subunit SctT n=1 Tax=Obesumbacterium proteus TaxID=82983 RepID=UPI0024313ACA|nr:type III secretion system export apparatus subunit SctT [Obesumbacterium proteus]
MLFGLYFDVNGLLVAAAIGFARVAPVFFMLPFFNNNILMGMGRNSVIMLVALGLWPYSIGQVPTFQALPFIALIAREAMIGVLLGCLLGWPFWVMHAVGSIIDNQRGATLSSSIDPANGIDTSEMANLFNLFAAVVYLYGGGMTLVLNIFQQSYLLCAPLGTCMPAMTPLLGVITKVMSQSLVVTSPIIAALLLSEVVLGLLSRFAPQMNAFAVSLTVKSGVAFFIMLLYFSPVLPERVMQMAVQPSGLSGWLQEAVRGDGK